MSQPAFQFPDPQSTNTSPWTVAALTDYIKDALETDPALQRVWVTGEISNFSRASSGHLYFTLKDSRAALSCVMWRSTAARLTWQPSHGAAVLALGRIGVYAPQGRYQLYVEHLQPAGVGDLHARFEELRDRLRAEGLFDEERKRPLPPFPRTVGIVTSPQAAALRDVLNILGRRYPLVRVLLSPTLVQGEQAPAQIVAALQKLDARDDVDLILLVRGGGSLEDLWAFNDEGVARAVAACRHPVISGVGHETDFTIADFAADLRAPTPSAAAELAVPDQAELRRSIRTRQERLRAALAQRLDDARRAVEQQRRALRRLSPRARLDAHRQQVDDLTRRLEQALRHHLALRRAGLAGLEARLAALSPLATLERGYAIVRRAEDGAVVRSIAQVEPGDALTIRVYDGQFGATAETG